MSTLLNMNILQAKKKLLQNRYLIGQLYKGTAIADLIIVPEGVGHHYAVAIEELSEQEESYEHLLSGFKRFTLLVTLAHPFLLSIELATVLRSF